MISQTIMICKLLRRACLPRSLDSEQVDWADALRIELRLHSIGERADDESVAGMLIIRIAQANNFAPSGNGLYTLWQHGNHDGDDDVDLADYNVLASNFSPAGYGAVPEPTGLCLLLTALLVLARVKF